ncbi:MAG: CDP-2,3-bis-(O-geranylgeranyl)-sn-glycerol synthase [Candidatus Thermoplasmatota archaeon]
MDLLIAALQGLWFIFPAMVPNSAAVLLGGGVPIDLGRRLKDGSRILGDGKTWAGLIGGIITGISVGLIQYGAAEILDPTGVWSFDPFPSGIYAIAALACGALMGDLFGSFIKRRLGMAQGAKLPILDMYNFVAGALLLTMVVQREWVVTRFVYGAGMVSLLTILIVVPLLHRGTNIIGYRLGKKKVPW